MNDFAGIARLQPLIDACVHCGFCLPTCPSYLVLGHEMDSPRGRVFLMKAAVEQRIALTSPVVQHFDLCLGCMACETACPSGVRYAPLIEATRAVIEHHHTRSLADRMFRELLFQILPYPSRLRVIAWPLALLNQAKRHFFAGSGRLQPARDDGRLQPAQSPPEGGHYRPESVSGGSTQSAQGQRLRPYRAEAMGSRGEVSASVRAGGGAPAPVEKRRLGRIRNLLALAPDVGRSGGFNVPERTPAQGARRLRVGLVTGCVQRIFFGHVNEATRRILAMEGCDVVAPAGQGCCGALALHAGRDEEARGFARGLIQTFERADVDQIVVNAAGCGSAMKEYGHLLREDPQWAVRAARCASKVRDLSETIAGLEAPRAVRHPLPLRVAYHDACHLAHAQRVRGEPRAILEAIPGVTVVPISESDICCGSAGIFNLVQPELAAELGQRKVTRIAESGADVVVTSNPGCMVQIAAAARRQGTTLRILHIAELLDASLQGLSAGALQASGFRL